MNRITILLCIILRISKTRKPQHFQRCAFVHDEYCIGHALAQCKQTCCLLFASCGNNHMLHPVYFFKVHANGICFIYHFTFMVELIAASFCNGMFLPKQFACIIIQTAFFRHFHGISNAQQQNIHSFQFIDGFCYFRF